MKTVKEIEKGIFELLKKDFSYTNVMQAPKLVKIVLSSGIGSFKDKKKIEIVKDRLSKIAGQKITTKGAKKSIASFKVRENDPVGTQVTLRGARMFSFLDKLLNIALPRTKDFRGLSTTSIDDMGNISLGLKEHTIFPETIDEELKDVFGIGVTVVTTAKSRKEAQAFFEHLGFPFKKASVGKDKK
ncbi:MAG: 50S ribosomal protein L5 [Candidatus Taylorbacteria bacterium]|nr:50S ribosomal protein L5 [Candidatus Taylorbacteria bacterium]